MEKINRLITEKDELLVKYLTKDLKVKLIKLKEQFDQQKIDDNRYIEENKHRKIVGYDEKYMPIYEL